MYRSVLTGEEQATLNARSPPPEFKPPTTNAAEPLTPLETSSILHFFAVCFAFPPRPSRSFTLTQPSSRHISSYSARHTPQRPRRLPEKEIPDLIHRRPSLPLHIIGSLPTILDSPPSPAAREQIPSLQQQTNHQYASTVQAKHLQLRFAVAIVKPSNYASCLVRARIQSRRVISMSSLHSPERRISPRSHAPTPTDLLFPRNICLGSPVLTAVSSTRSAHRQPAQ